MPALPSKLINKTLGIGVKRTCIGIGASRFRDISGGADLVAGRVDMLMAMRATML